MKIEIDCLKAENARFRRALATVASQNKSDELPKYDADQADFEGAFNMCIDLARAVLKGEGL